MWAESYFFLLHSAVSRPSIPRPWDFTNEQKFPKCGYQFSTLPSDDVLKVLTSLFQWGWAFRWTTHSMAYGFFFSLNCVRPRMRGGSLRGFACPLPSRCPHQLQPISAGAPRGSGTRESLGGREPQTLGLWMSHGPWSHTHGVKLRGDGGSCNPFPGERAGSVPRP